jgi:hypothetical protein
MKCVPVSIIRGAIALIFLVNTTIAQLPDSIRNKVDSLLQQQPVSNLRIDMVKTIQARPDIFKLEGGEESAEYFVLAFMEQLLLGPRIHVRYSSDGIVWHDGNFPHVECPMNITHGVSSGASRELGLIQWVKYDCLSSLISNVWGLGPTIWDNSATSRSVGTISSSPVAIDLGDNKQLVVFKAAERVVAKIYDASSSVRNFTFDIDLDNGLLNTNVEQRPAVTYSDDGKILIAWVRNVNDIRSLVTAVGYIDPSYNLPLFPDNDISEVSLPGSSFSGFYSNPDLTHNNQGFVLAGSRKKYNDTEKICVYTSSDGKNWTLHSALSMNYADYVAIASKSDGTMAVASVRRTHAGENILEARRYSNDSGSWGWNDVPIANVWGGTKPAAKEFTIIRYNGVPED